MRANLAIVALVLSACSPGGGDENSDASDSGGTFDAPAPNFVEPASGALDLDVTRVGDLTLRVRDVTAGLTTLVLDGAELGTLREDTPIGLLTTDELTFHTTGAMIPGRHRFQMTTPAGGTLEVSQEITATLKPAPAGELSAELEEATALTAEAIQTSGPVDGGVLLVADGGLIHVLRQSGTGWDADNVPTVEAEGLVIAPGDRGIAAAGAVTHNGVRVAWRVGLPGTRVDFADLLDGGPSVHRIALELDEELVGTVEYAELGRPLLIEDAIVVEVIRAADVEQPHPGDRSLVTVRIVDSPLQAGPPREVNFGSVVDIDATGTAVDIAPALYGGNRTFAARIDGVRPAIVEFDLAAGLLREKPTVSPDPVARLDVIDGSLTAVLGAFGSRTFAGVDPDRTLLIVRSDARGNNGTSDISPAAEAFPAATVVGPVAPGLLAGVPIFLVAYGDDAPVHAVLTSDEEAEVIALSGINCEQIALPATGAGNDLAELRFACLQAGELRLGTLRL